MFSSQLNPRSEYIFTWYAALTKKHSKVFKNMQKQKILFPENVERDNWNLRKTSVACVAACVTSNDWHCGKTLVECSALSFYVLECSALSFCVLFKFRITVDLSLEIIGHRVLTAVQGSRPHIPFWSFRDQWTKFSKYLRPHRSIHLETKTLLVTTTRTWDLTRANIRED